MELSSTYILSQICVIIYYLLVITTYQLKSRKTILKVNTLALIVMGISYACLNAYSGIAMVFLGILRNTMFYIDEKKGFTSDTITKRNIVELGILIALAIALSIFTYDGFWSLMSVVATMTYTISIWQKNTRIYKLLGLPIAVAGISYNIYIVSILGVIFESLSLLSAFIGFAREQYEKKTKSNIR